MHDMWRQAAVHARSEITFHQCTHQSGQSVEAYVRALYEHSEHCEFEKRMMREDHIRYQLVIGLADKELPNFRWNLI